jgi:YD repeat-containing protein
VVIVGKVRNSSSPDRVSKRDAVSGESCGTRPFLGGQGKSLLSTVVVVSWDLRLAPRAPLRLDAPPPHRSGAMRWRRCPTPPTGLVRAAEAGEARLCPARGDPRVPPRCMRARPHPRRMRCFRIFPAVFATDLVHLATITDPLGHTTTRTCDAVSRRSTQTDPLGRVTW